MKKTYIKKSYLLIVLILLVTLKESFALNVVNDYNDYSELKLNFLINGEFELIKTSEDHKIAEAITYLTFFPQIDNMQKIESIDFNSKPSAKITKESEEIIYQWDNPEEGKFYFGLDSEIKTVNTMPIIDEKIYFPINNKNKLYTEPTEFIDITPEIKEQADKIVSGEDDLYAVTFKIAYWIQQNIKYNLTTLTAEVVQKSSWVLKNKEGVCDELTNLFISMMRSLGIQARFISGMVYTNIDNKWSPHAWAEVYFPDKGWLPFDITYGEFGWIDPTHIKLNVNKDSGEPAVKYTWKAIDTKLEGKKIDLNTTLIEKGNKITSPLEFKVKTLENDVGQGSFVPIELEISNNNNYYMADWFTITKAPNLTESNSKVALLKPGEKKKIFWIAKIPENLEEGYTYLTTVEIEDQFHTKTNLNITYGKDLNKISLNEAKSLIEKSYQEKEIKTVSNKISIECNGPEVVLINESLKINCKLTNKGNTRLDNLKICYKKECLSTDLSIVEEKNIEIPINGLKLGTQTIEIEVNNENTKASDIVTIEVIENPNIKILSLQYPEKVKYEEDLEIKFLLSTRTPVQDIKININNVEEVEIDKLNTKKEVIITTKGKKFLGKDEVKFELEFKDLKDKSYKLEYSYPIEIIEIPWYIKILQFLNLI